MQKLNWDWKVDIIAWQQSLSFGMSSSNCLIRVYKPEEEDPGVGWGDDGTSDCSSCRRLDVAVETPFEVIVSTGFIFWA